MDGADLRAHFGAPGAVVLPVIHVLDIPQTQRNVEVALGEGAHGVFLINHDFGVEQFLPIVRDVRARFPGLWLGLNFLGVTGEFAFPTLSELTADGCTVDAYWADDARIEEHADLASQVEAKRISSVRDACGWRGLYFGGTAFKKQRDVAPADFGAAALRAASYMDVVTTSGAATGKAPATAKVAAFRAALGQGAMALASGVTPENATEFSAVDCFLVATGINAEQDFYNISPPRLARLMRVAERLEFDHD